MNSTIQALVLVLITIAMVFAVVLESPVIALAGLLITGGSVVWFSTASTKPLVRG